MTAILNERVVDLVKDAVIQAFEHAEGVKLSKNQITIKNDACPYDCGIQHKDYAFGADVTVYLEKKDEDADHMLVPVCITHIGITFPYKWDYIPLFVFPKEETSLHEDLGDFTDQFG